MIFSFDSNILKTLSLKKHVPCLITPDIGLTYLSLPGGVMGQRRLRRGESDGGQVFSRCFKSNNGATLNMPSS